MSHTDSAFPLALAWRSAGCEPPDQAIPRSAEVDEDDAEEWGQRVGKVVWLR